jgi:hypothetical protein
MTNQAKKERRKNKNAKNTKKKTHDLNPKDKRRLGPPFPTKITGSITPSS